MQEPILSFEGLDLVVYATAAEAEGHVESYDVAVYSTFDSSGQVLRFEAEGWEVRLRETGDYQPERLRDSILATLNATAISAPADASLDQLVSAASERFSLDQSLTILGRLGRRLFDRAR